MLKASALYIVIILALVIAIICSSLIVSAYFYKLQYQKKFRYDVLESNLSSGVNILLTSEDAPYLQEKPLSLFNSDADSISLKKLPWGVFDIGVVKAFIQKDTLYKVFSLANTIDSTKWSALYLIDEDRPLSVSGKTMIKGDAYIPKAGIKPAYVDNKAYEGDKRLIIGNQHNSEKKLPALNPDRLAQLRNYLDNHIQGDSALSNADSIHQSFLLPARIIAFKKKVQIIKNVALSGNIVLLSDTSITIDSSAVLNNVMIFAKSIKVNDGFHGNCQLFAVDSITAGQRCRFDYPSCMGVMRFTPQVVRSSAKIKIGDHTLFNGIIFTYEKTTNELQPLIEIGKNVRVAGQIYSQGLLKFTDDSEIDGNVTTSRFIHQNTITIFENYLINIKLNSLALSPYYLTSELMPVTAKKKKIMQWLETN